VVSQTSSALDDVEKRKETLWTIAVVLAVLWLLGLVSSYTLGGFIHILLVHAIVVVLINVIQGRREWRLESDTAQPDNRLGVSQEE
jgi:hypothetical protein